jgi:hypothetical protein
MRQHEPAGQRYTEAVKRFVGPPAIHSLRRQVVLDHEAISNAILMGPNARHVAASVLYAELAPTTVTFDFVILLARKSEGRSRTY